MASDTPTPTTVPIGTAHSSMSTNAVLDIAHLRVRLTALFVFAFMAVPPLCRPSPANGSAVGGSPRSLYLAHESPKRPSSEPDARVRNPPARNPSPGVLTNRLAIATWRHITRNFHAPRLQASGRSSWDASRQ